MKCLDGISVQSGNPLFFIYCRQRLENFLLILSTLVSISIQKALYMGACPRALLLFVKPIDLTEGVSRNYI